MIGASPFACRDERRGGLLCQLYLVSPCWNFCIRPSYLPSAMSWTSWSARLSSLALRSAFLRPCGSKHHPFGMSSGRYARRRTCPMCLPAIQSSPLPASRWHLQIRQTSLGSQCEDWSFSRCFGFSRSECWK